MRIKLKPYLISLFIAIFLITGAIDAWAATSRRTATNENVSTYGNNTRDYDGANQELTDWEQATDINLVTATQSEVLECYADVAEFTDGVTLAEATTNGSYFRIIRPASGEGHNGTPTTGVRFYSTVSGSHFSMGEDNSHFQDIVSRHVYSNASNKANFRKYNTTGTSYCIGCIAWDSNNTGASYTSGFDTTIAGTFIVVNCLATYIGLGNTANGFRCATANATLIAYNCTSDSTGGYNFYQYNGTFTAKNCCSSNGVTDDWGGTIGKTTCTDEGVTMTYDNAAGDDFHTSDSDVVDQGTDLSADGTFAFDDDIDGTTRAGTWDIGFDEYVAVGGVTIPIFDYHYRYH